MRDRKMRLQNQSGFTLIELMIVVAMLAIGAAVAVWSGRLILPDMHLKQSIRNLKSDIQLARLRAIRENTTISLTFDAVNNNYTIFYDNGDGAGVADDWIHHPDEPLLKEVAIPQDVNLADIDFPVNSNVPRVSFNRLGYPNIAGTVQMTNTRNNTRTIVCNMVAQVRIQ